MQIHVYKTRELAAKACATIIATGADKTDAVRTLVKGAINPNLPASALRMHPNAIIVLDEEAASKL